MMRRVWVIPYTGLGYADVDSGRLNGPDEAGMHENEAIHSYR